MKILFPFTECIPGSFGPNCDQRCGVCKDNEACDYRNGACPQGCAEGWTGSTCQMGKQIIRLSRGFYIYCPILLIHHRVLKKANDNHITVYMNITNICIKPSINRM